MNTFVLTEDQEMLRDLAQKLAREEIRLRSEQVDHAEECPKEGLQVLAETGLQVCFAPEEYGGAGLDNWSQISVIEEVAKECASTAWAAAQAAEVAECLLRCGTEAQKSKVVPELAAGGIAVAVDQAYSTVRAEQTDAGYTLNGSALHIPLVQDSGSFLLPAALGEETVWFLLADGAPGVQAEPGAGMLGMKGCRMGTLTLDNCRVAAEDAVPGKVQPVLDAARTLNMAAIASGIAQGALEEAISYVNQRVQFGRSIAQFDYTQQLAAELLAKAEAARALVWSAANVKDSGADYAYAAAAAKVFAADAASTIGRKCVQFMGGYGYSREYPIERKMRDAKMTELLAGSSAVQKSLMARAAVIR